MGKMREKTGYIKMIIKARDFYNEIKTKKELNKYRLVNGLFIVKYLNKDICKLVGDFEKAGSVFNKTCVNKIRISNCGQLFYKKAKLTKTNVWKKLNIKFDEEPIKEVLM